MRAWQFILWVLAVVLTAVASYDIGKQAVYDRAYKCETSLYHVEPTADRADLYICIMELPTDK